MSDTSSDQSWEIEEIVGKKVDKVKNSNNTREINQTLM